MKIINIILSIMPSFIHTRIRRILGAKIDSGVKIKFGSIINSKFIKIGRDTTIGPFNIINSDILKIGESSVIKPFSLISARNIEIGSYVQIAPLTIITGEKTQRSKFIIGNHSRIFPFCWIDTGEGVSIGKNVGVGGHTLIFTHGVWSNFLDGGPVTYAPVKIEDDVWLPWRVFVMPGVTIEKKTVVGANSVITKNVPENSLVAGTPAKILKSNFITRPTLEEQYVLLNKIFHEYVKHKMDKSIFIKDKKVKIKRGYISTNIADASKINLVFLLEENLYFEAGDLQKFKKNNIIYYPNKSAYIQKDNSDALDFIVFLRRFGIRLSIIKIN